MTSHVVFAARRLHHHYYVSWATRFIGPAALGWLLGCAPEGPFDPAADLVPPGVGGRADSGYVSGQALEVEGTFASEMRLDLSALAEAERQAMAVQLSGSAPELGRMVELQVSSPCGLWPAPISTWVWLADGAVTAEPELQRAGCCAFPTRCGSTRWSRAPSWRAAGPVMAS